MIHGHAVDSNLYAHFFTRSDGLGMDPIHFGVMLMMNLGLLVSLQLVGVNLWACAIGCIFDSKGSENDLPFLFGQF